MLFRCRTGPRRPRHRGGAAGTDAPGAEGPHLASAGCYGSTSKLYFPASVYPELRESESAFTWLERGIPDEGSGMLQLRDLADRFWLPIRSDPRFSALVKRVDLSVVR
jgi:hypothetical protein